MDKYNFYNTMGVKPWTIQKRGSKTLALALEEVKYNIKYKI